MSTIGQPERATQNRVIVLFRDELRYRYLGDWTDRPDNSNIEENLLAAYLTKSGYSPVQISKALYLGLIAAVPALGSVLRLWIKAFDHLKNQGIRHWSGCPAGTAHRRIMPEESPCKY
jgi:hypothetical protein